MAIPGSDFFIYVGYTLGGSKPTLYFDKGRYTQVHDTPSNIGWHPDKFKYTVRKNISDVGLKIIMEDIDEGDTAKESAFAISVIGGLFDSKPGEGTLFEAFSDDQIEYKVHVSRGRMVKVGDPDFDKQFDQAYAKKVLASGVLAPNEV